MEKQSVCSKIAGGPSTLYYNGTILTMDDECPAVQAVLVSGGRIRARGSEEELMAQKDEDTVCIDLAGIYRRAQPLFGTCHLAVSVRSVGSF